MTPSRSKNRTAAISRLAGVAPSTVEEAQAEELTPRRIPREYNPAAQKKLCDKLLDHMEGVIPSVRDTMSIQQLSNSVVQVMRYRHELEDRNKTTDTDAEGNEQMDSGAQRARNKMLDFGERASG